MPLNLNRSFIILSRNNIQDTNLTKKRMKLGVNNEDGIDTAIGSSQSHCQVIKTIQTWTVNIRYENMF